MCSYPSYPARQGHCSSLARPSPEYRRFHPNRMVWTRETNSFHLSVQFGWFENRYHIEDMCLPFTIVHCLILTLQPPPCQGPSWTDSHHLVSVEELEKSPHFVTKSDPKEIPRASEVCSETVADQGRPRSCQEDAQTLHCKAYRILAYL